MGLIDDDLAPPDLRRCFALLVNPVEGVSLEAIQDLIQIAACGASIQEITLRKHLTGSWRCLAHMQPLHR
jgi:hypothetical protein